MAEVSAPSQTIPGSKMIFYQQNDDTIRIRVYTSPSSFDFSCELSAAQWAALIAALSSAGDSYITGEISSGGADHTVNV